MIENIQNPILLIILCATVVSAAIVKFILPKILLVSLKKKILDPHDPRKIHKDAASRLGGFSFVPAIFIAALLAIATMGMLPSLGEMDTIYSAELIMIFVSTLILYLVGIYDDIVGVRYSKKFIVQIVTALLVIVSGIYLKNIYGVEEVFNIPTYIAVPLTIVLIVFITNALNLIDGINGLASMLSIMAFLVYGTLFLMTNQIIPATISYVAAGAILPFFYHNVFGVRKGIKSKIFMGDGGALVIGFLLSVMAIKLWNTDTAVGSSLISADICHVLAYTMLFVPCLDVVRVVLRRARMRKPLFLPDKTHIHHKFMSLGYSPQKSLLCIIIMQLFFMFLNIFLSDNISVTYIIVVDIVIWTLMHIWISNKIVNKNISKITRGAL